MKVFQKLALKSEPVGIPTKFEVVMNGTGSRIIQLIYLMIEKLTVGALQSKY